jgi:hypothetical protein
VKLIGKLEKCDEKSILNVKSSANSSERCASSLINIDKHVPAVQSKQLKQLCDDFQNMKIIWVFMIKHNSTYALEITNLSKTDPIACLMLNKRPIQSNLDISSLLETS